ncbi:hybrid sensor histidine kinase/response regulator [Rhodopirellula bahusiensis]|uniref:hybrid sensor histidine kinase/response regulator n=2 Tax=Rhodopirellula bahusiensis TaxID=2014065 RepID=UPI00326494E1
MEPSPDELRRAIAVLAHELRNPLSVFRAGVDLLSTEDSQQAQIKEVLLRQTMQMTRLVEDLSDISRAELNKLRIERRPLRLQEVVEETVDGLQHVLARRRQRLEMQVSTEPIWISGDRVRIGQMLSNLLSNASKYSKADSQIDLRVEIDRGRACLRVRDFGIGIAEDDLARIFDFLSQCESREAIEHCEGGLGIGLALARQIAGGHDGSITAHSEGLGKGSEFQVRLPTISRDAWESIPELDNRTFTPCRVLVVDDNRSSQLLLPALIGRLGDHEVEVAASGEETLEVLAAFTPDLILLDLGLPDMSGIELARIVRGMELMTETRIVALTGFDNEDFRELAAKAGIDAYRVKPVSVEMLRSVFEELNLRGPTSDSPIAGVSSS